MMSSARFQSSSVTKIQILVGLMVGLTACSDDVMPPRFEESSAASFGISAGEDVIVSNLWVATGSAYNVVPQGHVVGAGKYTDRNFTFSSIPTELEGYTFIRTANLDRSALPGNTSFLRFTVDRAVTVYVAHRDGIFRPAWLNENFTDTGLNVLNTVYASEETFSVFKRDYAAGTITLGSNADVATTLGMYTVVLKPTTTTTTAKKGRKTTTSPFKAVVDGVRPRGFGASAYTLSPPAFGAKTYYVGTTGDDANAGTSAAPFRTINRAAQVAVAGDVVNIANGTYQESVFVQNSGTAANPIVFQAQNRGGVILTGGQYVFQPAGWFGGKLDSGGIGVTIKGLIFRSYSDAHSTEWGAAAVRAVKNWRIEDCLFDKAGLNGVFVVDDSVTITRSTFQYTVEHALVALGKGNGATGPTDSRFVGVSTLQLTDVVLKGNFTNPTALDGSNSSSVIKILGSKGMVVDNMESSQNNGPGLWLDGDNFDYVIRNSYFHDNYSSPGMSPGRGIHLELNWGAGLVENNVIANNAAEGLAISNTWGVEVRNNLFVGNRECMRLSDWVNRSAVNGPYALKNISIHHNQFRDWAQHACISPYGDRPDGLNGSGAISYSNIYIDFNTYQPVRNAALSGWWSDKMFVTTIDAARSISTEMNGKIGTVQWPL